jgi:hydrogenase-4 component B
VIKAGIYGLLRLLSWLPPLPTSCAVVMLAFGMVSGVLGVLYALAQHDIKRLLAYHSVENIGIIGLGIGMGMLGQTFEQPALVALGYGGALLHVLNHAMFKGLLFLSAGAVIHATGTGDIERLGGLARKTPINAGLFLLAAVAICGLPPLNGFVSEWLLYGSLFTGAGVSSRLAAGVAAMGAVSLALMGGLALACFAKVFGVVFLGEPRDGTIQAHSTPLLMQIAMLIPAILCAAIGFLPGVFVPFTAGGVSAVSGLDAGAFARQVQSILSPVGQLSVLVTVLVAFVILLVLVRHVLRRRHCEVSAPSVVTWGCGFTRPSARMEYTASSFAWSLIQSFRSLLWTHREVAAPTGPFPAHSELESHTPDMAEHDVFSPLLQGVSRAFRMIRTVSWSGEPTGRTTPVATGGRVGPARAIVSSAVTALRQGRVHVYLAFLVLTLLAVFFVEALSLDHSAALPGPTAAISIEGDQK